MPRIIRIIKRNSNMLIRLLPFFAFIPPIAILYSLYKWSFEQTLHGRTFLLFFVWLVSLEIIIGLDEPHTIKLKKFKSARTILLAVALLLPTIYVIAENYCGLKTTIENVAKGMGVEESSWPAVSVEYLVFMVFLILIVLLLYGISGLSEFSVSVLFAGAIGTLFAIDNLYPYGRFTPLQALVPATTNIVAYIFNLLGYTTSIIFVNDPIYGSFPYLTVTNPQGVSARLGIAWACSGIESLIIYTVTIVLFLRKMDTSLKVKASYFAIGAVITYLINIFRIIMLFLLKIECVLAWLKYGLTSPQYQNACVQWQRFHDYYGMLYSVMWIVVYPLIIIGSQVLWHKIKRKTAQKFSGCN
ncbi:MAG: exosortase/archaeosortase family protein [Candidatus Bathyarchaeia archaeon]